MPWIAIIECRFDAQVPCSHEVGMTDSPHRQEPGSAEPTPYGYPGSSDPAYANQPPYGTSYPPQGVPAPTQQLPAYSQHGYGYGYDSGFYGPPYPPDGVPPEPPQPDDPPSRRWLWVLATGSVLTVLALVLAVVIINSAQEQVVVAPPLIPTGPDFTTPSSPPTTTRTPSTTSRPLPPVPIPTEPTPGVPNEPTTPGETQTVVYEVSGRGRAISITYVDTGGVLQTEFNVLLPWSKQVELASPADSSASVNIINFGSQITCSINVAGDVVVQRTGAGLTVCGALG
jgi:hypothetical protein